MTFPRERQAKMLRAEAEACLHLAEQTFAPDERQRLLEGAEQAKSMADVLDPAFEPSLSASAGGPSVPEPALDMRDEAADDEGFARVDASESSTPS